MIHRNDSPQRLGNVLVERGYLSPEGLAAALEKQHGNKNKLLGEILIETEACSEEQVVETSVPAFGSQRGLDLVLELPIGEAVRIDPVIAAVGRKRVLRYV